MWSLCCRFLINWHVGSPSVGNQRKKSRMKEEEGFLMYRSFSTALETDGGREELTFSSIRVIRDRKSSIWGDCARFVSGPWTTVETQRWMKGKRIRYLMYYCCCRVSASVGNRSSGPTLVWIGMKWGSDIQVLSSNSCQETSLGNKLEEVSFRAKGVGRLQQDESRQRKRERDGVEEMYPSSRPVQWIPAAHEDRFISSQYGVCF